MLPPRLALDNLAASPVLRRTAALTPWLFPGGLLHQAGLWAAWEEAFSEAERLFEVAALRYRAGLEVVPLARLRVHQLMVRARASSLEGRDAARCLEVERRLCRLDQIEAPWPPFPLVEASSLLASWLDEDSRFARGVAGGSEESATALDPAA